MDESSTSQVESGTSVSHGHTEEHAPRSPRTHTVPMEAASYAGYFSRDRAPVMHIESGDRLVLTVPEANWFLPEQTKPLRQEQLESWDARQQQDDGH